MTNNVKNGKLQRFHFVLSCSLELPAERNPEGTELGKSTLARLSNSLRKLTFMSASMMIRLLPNIKTHSQVDKDTTKLAYMRAAMTSLAYVHGITFSFMKVASLKS